MISTMKMMMMRRSRRMMVMMKMMISKDDNDLILSTARVSASATFDICHGDVDGVHVTL